MLEQLFQQCEGRWLSILTSLGIPDQYISGKHTACPICGGKDRFRFTNYKGRGDYYCNQCGPGSGVDLVMAYHRWDWKYTFKEIQRVSEVAVVTPPGKEDIDKARQEIKEILETCKGQPKHPVSNYLQSRGLRSLPSDLYYHPALPVRTDSGNINAPAMVAAIRSSDGRLVSIHKTFFSLNPRIKRIYRSIPISGCSIQLFPAEKSIALAEGIETAIAVYEQLGIPVWSAISAAGLVGIELPKTVEYVAIYGDNDSKAKGQEAAYTLKRKLLSKKIRAEVFIPPTPDTDWLDELLYRRGEVIQKRGSSCDAKRDD